MLRPVQEQFRDRAPAALLVGLDDPDDAAVWQVDDRRALVVTTDFFTPVLDDPYDYGAVAAANSLSDAYAMGARPFLALNIAGLPPKLPPEAAQAIFRGGAAKAAEAGVFIAGGHTIQDEEPKYGLVVLAWADPQRLLTKTAVQPGDALVLTKPLGIGCITTALKRQKARADDVALATRWMLRLNRAAMEAALEAGVRAATDVTGFSLLGHAWEMAVASGVGLRLRWDAIPVLPPAREYAHTLFSFAGGAFDNREYFGPHVQFHRDLAEPDQMLLFDPQTSGGLLLAVPPARWPAFQQAAAARDLKVWRIGEAVPGPPRIEVV